LRTARLITTYKCKKSCELCCNKHLPNKESTTPLSVILSDNRYSEIVLSGGEPMLFPKEILELVRRIRTESIYHRKIILYTAYIENFPLELLNYINGLTVSIHDEEDRDKFKNFLKVDFPSHLSKRLHYFTDVPLTPMNLSGWNVKFIEWIINCPVPEHEDVFNLEPF
jgi:pyruvate-formate lyase-activating enzyme